MTIQGDNLQPSRYVNLAPRTAALMASIPSVCNNIRLSTYTEYSSFNRLLKKQSSDVIFSICSHRNGYGNNLFQIKPQKIHKVIKI